MAIPDYQTLMMPFLDEIADGEEHKISDLTKRIADRFGLTEEERHQLLPSGQQSVISNRVAWTKTYLKKSGLLSNTTRGKVRISAEGLRLRNERPAVLDRSFLLQHYPSLKAFMRPPVSENGPAADPAVTTSPDVEKTPEEAMDSAYIDLRNALADELLERTKACTPSFFEQLVVKLLVAMGYGGTLADAGQAVGRTGDGGIDGIIKEDKLGLDVVCVQAKRYGESTVGASTVREFAGSMEAMRAKKGVLISTSTFSADAKHFVSRLERRIVLIDGKQLAQYMIDYGIGVTTARVYTVNRPDSDFFVEDL